MWSWRNEALAKSVCSGIIRNGIKISALKQQAKQHWHASHSPGGADTQEDLGVPTQARCKPHIQREILPQRNMLKVTEGLSTFSSDLQSKLTCKYGYQQACTCTFIHKHTCFKVNYNVPILSLYGHPTHLLNT